MTLPFSGIVEDVIISHNEYPLYAGVNYLLNCDAKIKLLSGAVGVACAIKLTQAESLRWIFHPIETAKACFYVFSMSLTGSEDEARRLGSWFVERNITRNHDHRKLLVEPFKSLSVLPASPTHTHGFSASLRSAANRALEGICLNAGYTPYHYSCALGDIGKCQRYYYHTKDLKIPFRDDPIQPGDAIVMVDVDYYPEMSKILEHFVPVLMYTLVPTEPCYVGPDYSYSIDSRGFVQYMVSGGGAYKHQIWDYDYDTLTVDTRGGFIGETLVFDVVQLALEADSNRRLIMLLPSCRLPSYMFYGLGLPNTKLLRRGYGSGDVRMVRNAVDKSIAIATSESTESVKLSCNLFESIRLRLSLKKEGTAQISDVERMLMAEAVPEATTFAPLLFKLFQSEIPKGYNIISTATLPTNFQTTKPLVYEEGKEVGVVTCSPLVSVPSLFPCDSYNNDFASIVGRVVTPCNMVVPPASYNQYAKEFVDVVVGINAGKGVPFSTAEVIAQQTRPAQVARINREMGILSYFSRGILKAFVKKEPYAGPTDPRNITQMSCAVTINGSRFTYSFKEQVLKKFPWFGPGMTPEDIVSKLRKIALTGPNGLEADLKRFDGSVSAWLQVNIVKRCYMSWVSEKDKSALHNVFQQVFSAKASTAHGMKYDPLFGTRSGSPFTTDGNTLVCAFVVYCGMREAGMATKEALARMNTDFLGYGDDSVSSDYGDGGAGVRAASLALGLKIDIVLRPEWQDVGFLGRVYPNLRLSSISYQNLERTLPRLHLSVNKQVSVEQAVANKALGYSATDARTPILGEWCRAIRRITGIAAMKSETTEDAFRVSRAWPQPPEDEELLFDSVCRHLSMDRDELDARRHKILTTEKLDSFPVVYENTAPPKLPAIVGGEVITVKPQSVKSTKCNHKEAANTYPIGNSHPMKSPPHNGTPIIGTKETKSKSQLTPPPVPRGEHSSPGPGVKEQMSTLIKAIGSMNLRPQRSRNSKKKESSTKKGQEKSDSSKQEVVQATPNGAKETTNAGEQNISPDSKSSSKKDSTFSATTGEESSTSQVDVSQENLTTKAKRKRRRNQKKSKPSENSSTTTTDTPAEVESVVTKPAE